MRLGIDVVTRDAQRLVVRLARLKSTRQVTIGGRYHEEPDYSQVHLDSSWTEAELDEWLYKYASEIEWVGCFELPAESVLKAA